MNIIAFFKSDYNFSAMLAKICNIESDNLFFMDKANSLKGYAEQESTIIIIDIDPNSKAYENNGELGRAK